MKKRSNPKPPKGAKRPPAPPAPPPAPGRPRGFQGSLSVYRVGFFGEDLDISLPPQTVELNAILFALASMENEKVDAVLKDFGIRLFANGKQVWPREFAAPTNGKTEGV